jgi:putative membrane protein
MNQTLAKVLYVAGVTTFCTFLGCWAVLAHQEQTPQATSRASARHNPAMSDENFVRNAAEGSMAEVKMGQLAEEKAQAPEVKNFAKRMVEEHSKALEEIKQLGSQEGINMPTDISHKDAVVYDRLSQLSGPEFDRAYSQEMVKDHQKDIAEFKHGENSAQKPAVKQFAQKTLGTLQSHLELAQHMQAHVQKEGISKGKTGGSSRR